MVGRPVIKGLHPLLSWSCLSTLTHKLRSRNYIFFPPTIYVCVCVSGNLLTEKYKLGFSLSRAEGMNRRYNHGKSTYFTPLQICYTSFIYSSGMKVFKLWTKQLKQYPFKSVQLFLVHLLFWVLQSFQIEQAGVLSKRITNLHRVFWLSGK